MNLSEIRTLISDQGSIRAAARFLNQPGFSERNIRRLLKSSVTDSFEVERQDIQMDVDVEALLARRIDEFKVRNAQDKAKKWHTVHMKSNAPIGLGFIGDLHLDDDGTDIKLAFEHAELFNGSVEGFYAGFLGDAVNNWDGRLTKLWADQSITAKETQALLIRYMENIGHLIFALQGNHHAFGDRLDYFELLMSDAAGVVSPHGQHIRIVFPNGKEVRINARHTFPGKSQWVTNMGALKAAQLDGSCDIYAAGHIHCSGYSHTYHEGFERMCHALQVASYKALDDYADELGLPKRDLYQCPVALIDPHATSPVNFVRFEFDPFEGAERIKWMRSRH